MGRALRYAPKHGTRKVAHRTASAAECIGELYDGVHVTGLTAGQFSAIDALEHIANEIGPCFAWVSTWTTGIYDIQRAADLAKNEHLLGVRMLIDRGTFEKSPKFAGPLIAALGADAFRCLSVHAKVTVFVSEDHTPLAVMRSSMNLNKNLRTEQFDISVDRSVSGFYADWFDVAWDEASVGESNVAIMKAIYSRFLALPSDADEEPASVDDAGDLDALSLGSLVL
ncbi:hypothetical protein [Falsihalocynthiibacter arcticus]|uniref:hypothetical protein n=1 Tax=Falsihalocynthiibacter arcticus TaxID=1579316 RepID=UPI003001DEC0